MDVKGMRISACPDTDRRRTRSRRLGVCAAPSGGRGIPGHGA